MSSTSADVSGMFDNKNIDKKLVLDELSKDDDDE